MRGYKINQSNYNQQIQKTLLCRSRRYYVDNLRT